MLRVFFTSVLCVVLTSCGPTDSKLDQVRTAGELVVVTVNSPTTYYEGSDQDVGFEYDMAKAFATYLGVDLKVVVVKQFADVLPALQDGRGDLAAAGITITDERKKAFRFSLPYQYIHQQLVYRYPGHKPRDFSDLQGRDIAVVAGTSYVTRLEELKKQYPRLEWHEIRDQDVGDLLEMVWDGLLEYTIADSQIVKLQQQHFPELRVAFNMQQKESLAWAFRRDEDESLYHAANLFMKKIRRNGELKILLERYYGGISSNPVNMSIYQLRIQNRLPRYQLWFEESGKKNGIDWRLLAAMGYQESFWNPKEISPTGVRGIMMLTEITANRVGIKNRLDPPQSIEGGARYLREMYERLPKDIQPPDRLWMALAAYNVGFHHLMDARKITAMQHADPNQWLEVEKRLPLLAQSRWYRNLEYGYARGWEPVRYVNRIRSYYDVLKKVDEEEKLKGRHNALDLHAPAI